jgi:hypothetical protein
MQTLKLLQELSIDIYINIKEIQYLPILQFYIKNTNNLINYLFNLMEEINLEIISLGPNLYIPRGSVDLGTSSNTDLFKLLRLKVCEEDRDITSAELNKIVSDLL